MDIEFISGQKRKRNINTPSSTQEKTPKYNETKIFKIKETFCGRDRPFHHSFCVFKSCNNIYNLIYSNVLNSIIALNLDNYQKIIEIKNAHTESIKFFEHYYSLEHKTDLFLSMDIHSIKIWKINNFSCIYHYKNILNLFSACFIRDINETKIVMDIKNDKLKVYNLKGEEKKEMNIENQSIVSIESYYDSQVNQNYIILGNDNIDCVISYNYHEDKIYHKYDNYDYLINNFNVYEDKKQKKVLLIYVTQYCTITFWDFHTAEQLQVISIFIGKDKIYSTCLYNDKILFVGNLRDFDDRNAYFSLRLIDLDKQILVKGEEYTVENIPITIKKIDNKNDKYLICQEHSGEIIIWKNYYFY